MTVISLFETQGVLMAERAVEYEHDHMQNLLVAGALTG
jgi:hypothetical protein